MPEIRPVPPPAALLQKLIQFDTTNPPGRERGAIEYLRDLLSAAGVESTLVARDPARPNLIARLKGTGQKPPLLLYGHVDVVTTENQTWSYPPFEGRLAEDYIWGRGALDMKGGVAMLVSAFLRARQTPPPGDVILALVADEEAGGDFGAKFLVEQHPEYFAGVQHALGEFGGFTLDLAGRRFYPIQTSEKQICWITATVRGPAGHGSMPVHNGAVAQLGRLLQILSQARLPVHITPPAQAMVQAIAGQVGGGTGLFLRQLLNPGLTDGVLAVLGERGRSFAPLLRHTVSPTVLHGSTKINVIPGAASVGLDGRLLPGYRPEALLQELQALCPRDVTFEVDRYDPGPDRYDPALFPVLAGVLRELDPAGTPVPLLLSGVTDARFFARLGIQTYGFLPMQLPADFNFSAAIHAADERIPAAAVDFGTQAITMVLQRR